MSITVNILRHPRMRTNFLVACVCVLGLYMVFFDRGGVKLNPRHQSRDIFYTDEELTPEAVGIDRNQAEEIIANSHKVQHMEYHSPFKVANYLTHRMHDVHVETLHSTLVSRKHFFRSSFLSSTVYCQHMSYFNNFCLRS